MALKFRLKSISFKLKTNSTGRSNYSTSYEIVKKEQNKPNQNDSNKNTIVILAAVLGSITFILLFH